MGAGNRGFHERKRLIQLGFRFKGAAHSARREAISFYALLQTARTTLTFSYPKGKQEGKQEEALSFVTRLLTRRFGEIAPMLQEQIRGLSVEQLEALGEALLNISEVADLVTWLEQQERSSE